jgi:hypothetical protein
MSPRALFLIGIVLLVASAATAILNLHRVAALGLPWLPPLLLVLGAFLMMLSRRGRR